MVGKVVVSMLFLIIPAIALFLVLEQSNAATPHKVKAMNIDMQYIEYSPISDVERCQSMDQSTDPELYRSLC